MPDYDHSDVNRLLKAFRHQETDILREAIGQVDGARTE
jgi:hypothetical protein